MIGTTNWIEPESTSALLFLSWSSVVWNTTRSEVGGIYSGTFSEFTEILVSNSIDTTNWVEYIITKRTAFIGRCTITIVFGSVIMYFAFFFFVLHTPTSMGEFLAEKHHNTFVNKSFSAARANGFITQETVGNDWVCVGIEISLVVVI